MEGPLNGALSSRPELAERACERVTSHPSVLPGAPARSRHTIHQTSQQRLRARTRAPPVNRDAFQRLLDMPAAPGPCRFAATPARRPL